MNTEVQQTKTCKRCGIEKPATMEFYHYCRGVKDGLTSICKICHNKQTKKIRIASKPIDHSKRNKEIYRMYYNTECNNPMKRQMLAIFYDITETELNQIIKTEDEKHNMARWTKEQTDTYYRLTASGEKAETIAAAMGVQKQAVYDQRRREKLKNEIVKAQKPEGKPAIINEDFEKEFPKSPIDTNATYAECAPDELQTPEPVNDVNAKIRDLCELPDPPKQKTDYTESLLETLREALEDKDYIIKVREKSILMVDAGFGKYMNLSESLIETLREESESDRAHYVKLNEILSEQEKALAEAHDTIFRQKKMIDDYQRNVDAEQVKSKIHVGIDSSSAIDAFTFATLAMRDLHQSIGKTKPKAAASIFDRAHDIITLLRHSAEDQDISVESITLTINKFIVDVSGTNASGECVGWHKKYQPTAGTAD